MKRQAWFMMAAIMVVGVTCGVEDKAKDLNPVKFKTAPSHPPVVLVEDGHSKASLVVATNVPSEAVKQLQSMIEQATGAKLPIVVKSEGPVIVIGDTEAAAEAGLAGTKMPTEGFAIKTAPNRVFIVGNGDGIKWGICEFLERYVGVRWYFPPGNIGLSIPKTVTLRVPAVWLEDAPFFRLRDIWPPVDVAGLGSGDYLQPLQSFLRAGKPIAIQIHTPYTMKMQDYMKARPEMFQLKLDSTRDLGLLCYGNSATLEMYLEEIQKKVDGKACILGIVGKNITVSPSDVELACYCPDCRKLWDTDGGQYGSASKVMAVFVDKLARAVQKRWPDQGFTVAYVPYLNYQRAPAGFQFPDNVEITICGMPGLASCKEPAIRDSEQANIDRWIKISGRKVQNWHYDCWPASKTKATYQYPHVIKEFYSSNREKTVGSFINGEGDHWLRQHISLYCWMKCLWNPDFDVDAAVDTFCERMFGPAAKTMRALVGMQIDGWEKSRWPGGRFSAKGIYEVSFPRETVKTMEMLFRKAMEEGKSDPLLKVRLGYYAVALNAFFKESKDQSEGSGLNPLRVQKVGENPVVDGRLDDKTWERAEAVPFMVATGKDQGKPAKYPTEVKAVWSLTGVTFGFRMNEPNPDKLVTKNGGHDNGAIWWDDNVEIFVDVTGKKEGEFYQLIINANGDTYDAKMGDTTWQAPGMKCRAYRGKDFWSLEVFLPFDAFSEAAKPGPGVGTAVWQGNFTRHRMADAGQPGAPKESSGEYQRMNTTGAAISANLADFAPVIFQE